ncbi:hypothetical protein F4780DRAFT_758443 [Xylariomycetidae sp. FL0641]|nr:hypothetical protein F4780DRAFT_758443 [Xylariomycetidae sp. FL0641]
MLSEKELEDAAHQLADFRHNNALSTILERYSDLLANYKRLKSDYEEEREGRERYKQLARGQERNPFVLVLVDGDGYIFDEEMVAAGAEGGSRAAQRLNEAIKSNLRKKGLEDCEIVIRVYANLVGLSKALSKAGLCGAEKRSLAPFVASFTRSYGLTDFVDAGELKENADFKLRAMLRMYAENAQCKHIYFAACHDVGYVSDLTPFRGNHDRVTLIKTSSVLFHSEYSKLGLGVDELPGVFRLTPLPTDSIHARKDSHAGTSKYAPTTAVTPSPIPSYQYGPAAVSNEAQKPCSFYASGKCKYGKACKHSHAGPTKSTFPPSITPPSINHAALAQQMSRHLKIEDGPMDGFGRLNSGQSPYGHENTAFQVQLPFDPASQLPRKKDIPNGYVAINQSQQRLDAYIPTPSSAIMTRLRELSARRNFCNNKQLTDSCSNENCEYDHNPLPEELLPGLESLSRSMACPKRDRCRNAACVQGHICQNPDCKHRGGKAFCRIPNTLHLTDLRFYSCVPATDEKSATLRQRLDSMSVDEFEDDITTDGVEL